MFFGCNLSSQKEGSKQVKLLICKKDLLLSFSWKGHIGALPRAAVGTSSVWSHASSRGAPQDPSWLPGNPTLELHRDLLSTPAAFSSCEHSHKAQRAQRILTAETKMCIFVIISVDIVITCITFLCISLSWQFFIKHNVCLGEMLSLLYYKGMHLSPSELSFSLHAQKISPSMENSQTSVLCAE